MTNAGHPESRKCNCCCGCEKEFSPEEIAYYEHVDGLSDTTLCFDCQNEYEAETDAKWAEESDRGTA